MSLPVSPENLLKALYETLPDPVLIVDENRNILAANGAASVVFGYSEQEFCQLPPEGFYVPAEAAQEPGDDFHPLDMNAAPGHQRFDFRCKDGSTVPVEITASRIRDEDGRATGLVVVLRDLSETIEAQNERQRVEGILNTALNSISEGFVVFDEQDRLVLCDDAHRKLYSISAPALQVGNTFEAILRYGLERGQYPDAGDTPESRETWLAGRLKRYYKPDGPFLQRVAPDRWLQIEELVTAENYRVGVRTDVSALRRAKSEAERLGLILEGVTQEVYLMRINDRKIVYANKSACENLQYSLEELRELDLRQINVDPSPTRLAEKFSSILSGESRTMIVDTRHRRRDGTIYDFRVRWERMDDEAEPVLLALGDDITERLGIERALKRKEHEFQTLVQNIPDFITRAKPDTTLTYVNENYARFIGLDADEMIGRKFLEFLPEDDRPPLIAHLNSLTPERSLRTSRQAMQARSGERLWYLWSNLMIFEGDVPVELVSVGRDITEVQEAQNRIARQSRELELRNDALEQFSAVVSHDLKAPLRQIRLFAEMIAEDVKAGKTADLPLFSGYISERSTAMEGMTSSLLEYSQLAYRRINPETFSLSRALQLAWKNLSVNADEAQGELITGPDVEVYADFNLLTQLFQNLFANSLKYRRQDKPAVIRVQAQAIQDGLRINVEDCGIGIDSEQSERIFGVFQRLHSQEKLYSGTGIGLALCRRIAESHDGSIVLDASYQGGARFVVTLPA
jgi:PAS domain S-box-containing protein